MLLSKVRRVEAGSIKTQSSRGCGEGHYTQGEGQTQANRLRSPTFPRLFLGYTELGTMEERIRFIDHQGKKILLVDLSKCPVNQVEKIVRSVPDYVTVQPLGSVLVLTDFTGATFDRDAIRATKETAVFDKPFVKKSALIGTESLPRDFYEGLTQFSRRELVIFKTREEALDWLAGDSAEG
jgi:hypothetical protein